METFKASSPEVTSVELLELLEENAQVKKYLSFNLLKLCRRAIKEVDLPLLKTLVEQVGIDFNQGQFKSLVTQLVVQESWKEQ